MLTRLLKIFIFHIYSRLNHNASKLARFSDTVYWTENQRADQRLSRTSRSSFAI